MEFTPDALVTLAGVILSLVFGLVPVLREWFDEFDPRWKPLFMAGVLLLVAAGKLAYDCQLETACMAANWGQYLMTWLMAVVANQTTYQVAVRQPARAREIAEFYEEPGE